MLSNSVDGLEEAYDPEIHCRMWGRRWGEADGRGSLASQARTTPSFSLSAATTPSTSPLVAWSSIHRLLRRAVRNPQQRYHRPRRYGIVAEPLVSFSKNQQHRRSLLHSTGGMDQYTAAPPKGCQGSIATLSPSPTLWHRRRSCSIILEASASSWIPPPLHSWRGLESIGSSIIREALASSPKH